MNGRTRHLSRVTRLLRVGRRLGAFSRKSDDRIFQFRDSASAASNSVETPRPSRRAWRRSRQLLADVAEEAAERGLVATLPEEDYTVKTMQPLKADSVNAVVKNGRLVLDEPTDLPEGQVVELVPLDEVLARGGDYLDDEERAELEESLRESIEQMKNGEGIDAAAALAQLRAHR